MECTIKYFQEVYATEKGPNDLLLSMKKGIPKSTSDGVKYLLVEDEEENI